MRWAKKTLVKLFRLSLPIGGSIRKSADPVEKVYFFYFFEWIHPSENSVEKS